MPITQDRLISLIEVAETLLLRMQAIKETATVSLRTVQAQRGAEVIDTEIVRDAMYEFEDAVKKSLNIPTELLQILYEEKAHFQYSASRNRTAAAATRRFRQKMKIRQEEIEAEFEIRDLESPVPSPVVVREYEETPGPRPSMSLPKMTPTRQFNLDEVDLLDVKDYLLKTRSEMFEELSPSEIGNYWRRLGADNQTAQKLVDLVTGSGMCIDSGKYGGNFSNFTVDASWKPKT